MRRLTRVIIILLACSGAVCAEAGKNKSAIDLQGIKSMAVLPFTYSAVMDDAINPGLLTSDQFREVFQDKCKLNQIDQMTIKKQMTEDRIDLKNPIPQKTAVEIGKKLNADAVMIGHVKSYNMKHSEVRLQYQFDIINVQTGVAIYSEEIDDYEKDMTNDFQRGISPASPELLTERLARSIAKKIAKRMKQ
jgi:hypothetical protein